MYSYGPPHMAVQKQDDQHEHTFSSYVRIRDAVLKTYLGRWTIGRSGERGSGISVLPARYDDDDIYIYVCVCVCVWLGNSRSFKRVWLNSKDTFYMYNLIKILSSFLISVLVSGWNWWMNLPKLSRELSDSS